MVVGAVGEGSEKLVRAAEGCGGLVPVGRMAEGW